MPYSHFSQFFFWNKLRKSTFSVCYVLNVQSTIWCATVCGCHHFGLTFIKRLENMFWVVGKRPGEECIVPRKWDQNSEKSHIVGGKFSLQFFFVLYTPQPLFSFLYWYMKKIMMGIHIPHGVEFSTHVVSRFWIFPT